MTFPLLWFLFLLMLWLVVLKPLWAMLASPKSDLLRIKRDYEGQGRRVVASTRSGTMWGSRSGPTYRLYNVVVSRHDGQEEAFKVGVQVTLFGDADLFEEDAVRRKAFFLGSQTHFG